MIDRRELFLAAGGVMVSATSRAQPAAATPAAPADPTENTQVTAELLQFARNLEFEHLPPSVVHAAKRYILDSVGCMVAGHQTDKGRIAVAAIDALGGAPDARIVGTKQKTAATHAAFANGELTNALDYDAIPHIPPFVLPPILAVAEKTRASGKAVILAVVIAHEVSVRLGRASGQGGPGVTQSPHPVLGIGVECIIGAALAVAKLLGLDESATQSAVGLAAYYCPPRSSDDWETRSPMSMVKYTPAGWLCQGAVTAALFARAGFTGPADALDGPRAFPYYMGWAGWKPQLATVGLGDVWHIESVDFKPYACCRFIHSQLDCMVALVSRHRPRPERIQKISSVSIPLPANPDKMNVRTQPDAQFSTPYMLALAASGIALDANCQSPQRLGDPRIRRLMSKITWGKHPQADAAKKEHPNSFIARVEMVVDGHTFVEETLYASGTAGAGLALSDDHLNRKAADNFATALSSTAALDTLWKLEDVSDVAALVDELTPS